MIFRNLLFIALLYSPVAQARMYQWIDPDSGTTQLSGKPPVWYRNKQKGPRIIVIENGKVIDDTSIKVSDEIREMLRQRAYMEVEKDQSIAIEKAVGAEKFKSEFESLQTGEAIKTRENTGVENTEIVKDDTPGVPEVAAEPATGEDIIDDPDSEDKEVTEEQMRARIQEWENKRTEEARKLLEPDT